MHSSAHLKRNMSEQKLWRQKASVLCPMHFHVVLVLSEINRSERSRIVTIRVLFCNQYCHLAEFTDFTFWGWKSPEIDATDVSETSCVYWFILSCLDFEPTCLEKRSTSLMTLSCFHCRPFQPFEPVCQHSLNSVSALCHSRTTHRCNLSFSYSH